MQWKGLHTVLLLTIPLLAACTNPFAPGIREGDPFGDLLGDPSTIDGFYARFKNAYELRDTSLYGPLIHPDFNFTFRDDETNVDVSWGRSREMTSTYNLFANSEDIQLHWNDYTASTNDKNTRSQVIRRFDLTVLDREAVRHRADGNAGFLLIRQDSTENWRLTNWIDEF